MGSLPPEKAGVGSAVNDTTRELGGTLGVAVVGSVFTSIYASKLAHALTGSVVPSVVGGRRQGLGRRRRSRRPPDRRPRGAAGRTPRAQRHRPLVHRWLARRSVGLLRRGRPRRAPRLGGGCRRMATRNAPPWRRSTSATCSRPDRPDRAVHDPDVRFGRRRGRSRTSRNGGSSSARSSSGDVVGEQRRRPVVEAGDRTEGGDHAHLLARGRRRWPRTAASMRSCISRCSRTVVHRSERSRRRRGCARAA